MRFFVFNDGGLYLVSSEKWYFKLREQWSWLLRPSKHNWVGFTFINLETDWEAFSGTWTIEGGLLGFWFRISGWVMTKERRALEERVSQNIKDTKTTDDLQHAAEALAVAARRLADGTLTREEFDAASAVYDSAKKTRVLLTREVAKTLNNLES